MTTTYADEEKVRDEIKDIKVLIDNTLKAYIKSTEITITLPNNNENGDLDIKFFKASENDALKALINIAEIRDQLLMFDNNIAKEMNEIQDRLKILECEKGYLKQLINDLKRNESLLKYIADQTSILNIVNNPAFIPKLTLRNKLIANEDDDISPNNKFNGIIFYLKDLNSFLYSK